MLSSYNFNNSHISVFYNLKFRTPLIANSNCEWVLPKEIEYYQMFIGTGVPGTNYASPPMKAASIEECAEACEKYAMCNAFTFWPKQQYMVARCTFHIGGLIEGFNQFHSIGGVCFKKGSSK